MANKKKIIIVCGARGSGKSSLVEKLQVASKSTSRIHYDYSKNLISLIQDRQLVDRFNNKEIDNNLVIECPLHKLKKLENQLNKKDIFFKRLFIEVTTDDFIKQCGASFEKFEISIIHTQYQP